MIYSAMRHFAEELRARGWVVDYHLVGGTADFFEGMTRHVHAHHPERLLVMEPNSFLEREGVEEVAAKVGVGVEFSEPVQFLRGREDFVGWARGKGRLLMETHYREMRRRLGVLVDSAGQPVGGQWNLDSENRKTFAEWKKGGCPLPAKPLKFLPDAITKGAMRDVEKWFPAAPGRAADLWVPVTRADALMALGDFVANRLGCFGEFEDLMSTGNPTLFHSLLSVPINMGLLSPMECVEAAVDAFRAGQVPLNSVEGFVRQILGWREFVNGVYWLKGPGYSGSNALEATRDLPEFFYSGETDLRCLREVLRETRQSAYNHHIQRLMVLGNFLLIAGIRPDQALRWFTEMYVDAFDWVMAANVIGMSLHADGGFMATKPYAASAAYIAKMSDYCRGCRYKPDVKSGPAACPYNLLYWDFFDRNAGRFASNPRTSMMVSSWRKRPADDRRQITAGAAAFLDSL